MAVTQQGRAERFAEDITQLRIAEPSSGRHATWLRVGAGLMVVGLLAAVIAVVQSTGTTNPLQQRDALVLATAGVVAAIVGSAVYLRFAVTKVLRFWLARLSFDLQENADRKAGDR